MIPGQLLRVHTEADRKPPFGAQLNWASEANRGLVGCWLFNEGAGGQVADMATLGTLPLVGGARWTVAGVETAFGKYVGGVTQFDLPRSAATIIVAATCTVDADNQAIFAGLAPSTSRAYYNLYYRKGGSTVVLSSAWKTWDFDNTGYTAPFGRQTVYSFTVDAVSQTLYTDGIPVWSEPRTTTPGASTTPGVEFGYNTAAGYIFQGIIGYGLVYSRALTADEIAVDYHEPWGQSRYLVPTFARIFDMGAGTTPYIPSPLILGTQALGAI